MNLLIWLTLCTDQWYEYIPMSGVPTSNIRLLIWLMLEVETLDIDIYLYHWSVRTAADDDLFYV